MIPHSPPHSPLQGREKRRELAVTESSIQRQASIWLSALSWQRLFYLEEISSPPQRRASSVPSPPLPRPPLPELFPTVPILLVSPDVLGLYKVHLFQRN